MAHYSAPLDTINFVLFDTLKSGALARIPGFEDASQDMMQAVIGEAAKMASGELEPINASGDREGCQYDPELKDVVTPAGFKEAYAVYREGGWSGLSASPQFGGQGLPHLLKMVVDEMVCSTNLSFGMYPGLSHGAIDLLTEHGSEELQQAYLPQLVSGTWTGTMCLTEPHCGTDLGLITTRAEPAEKGGYAISGTKIWITGGEHDLAENIVHLVLAKLPDAPEGSKGISLFLVPKILPDGSRNAVHCGGLEHKMGIKASATCVMNFDGAQGWLVGEPNQGLKCMFTMMNAARLMVGVQGLGLAESAYQVSLGFAKERLQSRSLAGSVNPGRKAEPIIVHPDVRRMLLRQKVVVEGARALAYWAGLNLDLSIAAEAEENRERADDLVQILTPVVKSFLTDEGFASIDQALQSMGGAGFTQDWPVEQFMRDARIARIYEGTNGIQALDLVGRKLTMRGGRLPKTFLWAAQEMLAGASEAHTTAAQAFMNDLQQALLWLGKNAPQDPEQAGAVATPLLRMFALTSLAVLWAKMAAVAQTSESQGRYSAAFLGGKVKCADHFYRLFQPEMGALLQEVRAGKETLMAFAEGEF